MATVHNARTTTYLQLSYHDSKRLELLKASLHQLTPSQLRELRGVINTKLDDSARFKVTDEEQRLINSLF